MQSQTIESLLPRLERLIEHLEGDHLPLEDRLWDIEAIAAWLRLSGDTVSRSVVTRASFPSPVQPVIGPQARRRWFAGEVIRWARQNRGRLPASRAGRPRKNAS